MLILSRKPLEAVVVGGGGDGFERLMKVTVLEIKQGTVRLGFDVAADLPIHRAEVLENTPNGLLCQLSGDFNPSLV